MNPFGFITDPRKIVEFPLVMVEMTFEFVQKIMKVIISA